MSATDRIVLKQIRKDVLVAMCETAWRENESYRTANEYLGAELKAYTAAHARLYVEARQYRLALQRLVDAVNAFSDVLKRLPNDTTKIEHAVRHAVRTHAKIQKQKRAQRK